MKTITLSNLSQFSEQKVFDYIAEHLLVQNEKSISHDGANFCAYKSKKGNKILKCSVGCLIPDYLYSESFENKGYNELVSVYGVAPYVHIGLITDMQALHDYHRPENWINELFKLSYERNLDCSILKKYK